MSMTVDRTGVFRAVSVDHGLGQTRKASWPQFNVNAKLTAYYDEDSETWVDWSEFGQEVDCRLVLICEVGKKKERGTTLSFDQVQKVFNWDGADLQVLAETKPGVKFQVTIKDNDPDYADKTPYQVSWIDDFDADPTQKVTKCSVEEIKGLNAKYAALLKAKATPKAPAKAGKKGTVTKKVAPKAPPKAPATPPAAPVAGGPPETKQVKNYTKAQAWQVCAIDLRNPNYDDEALGIAWQAAIHTESNGKGEEALTGEGWWNVKEKVLTEVGAL